MKKSGLLLASILMLFSFLTVACGSSEDNEKSGEKTSKKKIELTIDQTTVTTDENGKALIEGTVDSKAKLSIDGTIVKQDSDGRFTFTKIINSDSEARIYAKLIAIRKNYNDEKYTVIINNNSKAYNDNIAKQEAIQKEAAEKAEPESKEAEEKAKQEEVAATKAATNDVNTPSDDTVYGTLASKDSLTKEDDILYKDEELNVLYSIVEKDEIFQVLIQLGDESTFRKDSDKNHLTELARDYMESDITLIQTVSDESFVYESPSINKTYTVDYMLNDEGYVIAIYITQAM